MRDSQIRPEEHSEIKVKLLKLYLEKYMNILMLAKGVNEVLIYDLFCGEGIYENEKEGSPVIILRSIKDIYFNYKSRGLVDVKFHCIYNDIDAPKIKKLSEYIETKKLHYPEIGSLKILNDSYQNIKNKIYNRAGQKSFVFIDPYGYKDISLKDIEGILGDRQTEVLLFLPTHFMYRFEKNATPPSLYNFLTEVMNEDDLQSSTNGVDFITKLRDGFGNKLSGRHYVDSFIISRDLNQFFALFFFTSHLYGFEKFLEAKWQIDEEEGRGWTPTNNSLDLFSIFPSKPNTDKFEQNLMDFLKNERSNIAIHRFTIENRHLTKHANDILKNNQNRLSIRMNDGSIPRKGAFYIGWTEVRTNIEKCYIKLK